MHLKFSIVLIVQNTQEKIDLEETRVNITKTIKVCVGKVIFILGKNGCPMSSSLGGMLIIMVRQ